MYTINTEGQLNNYAVEPNMYYAVYPSVEQQRQYAKQAGFAALLIGALLLTAFAVG